MRHLITLSAILTSAALWAQPPYPLSTARNFKLPAPSVQEAHTSHRQDNLPTRSAAQTLWSETFDSGLNGWTVNTSQGGVSWEVTSTGNTAGYTPPPLQSTTGFPGGSWIVADSDEHGTAGVPENTTITSPAITGFDTVPYMLLSFEQSFRQLNTDQTIVEVSGNGGLNWTLFPVNLDVPGNQSTPGVPASQLITLNISSALSGGSGDIRIRFRWMSTEGYTYSWQVDDVNLIRAADNDLKLVSATHSDWNNDEPDFERLAYTIYPQNEVRELNIRANVINNGSQTQTNVRLQVNIDGPGSNDVQLFSDPVTLTPTQSDSLFITGYTPPAVTGNYEVTYSLVQDQTEDEPGDNMLVRTFKVDPFLFSRDDGTMQSDYSNEGDEYQLGNWFHVNAFTNTLYAVQVALSDRTDPGSIVTAVLYDDNLDYIIQSEEYTVQASDLNSVGDSHWITLPLIDYTDLDGDNDYFVAVHHYGGSDEVWVATSGASPDHTSLIYDAPQSTWFYVGVTPMVRMTFDPTALIKENDATPWRPRARPSLFSGSTTIDFTMDTPTAMRWELRDISGRLLRTADLGTLGSGQHEVALDGNDLASGTYFFTLRGDGRNATLEVVRTTDR